tara:strand:+ start:2320 stop:3231 length:912 start_codon:yes stop_codon:yes gene_type:complete
LKVVYDVVKHKKKIQGAIRKYGHFAEHNYKHYLYCENSEDKNVFFDYGNDKGMLMQFDKKVNIWSLFPNGILAPEKDRLDLLRDALHYTLKEEKAKKLTMEVSEDIRKGILQKFKRQNGMRICAYLYTLHWPLYNMKSWDPKLRGNKMKKLRNIRNRFYKKYRIKVKDTKEIPKEQLKKIFNNWLKKRSLNDRVDTDYYLNLINNDFKGIDIAKTLYVDGRPSTITAGWRIPNSNNYYSAIGIVDYSYPGLGEVVNIDDLNRLKRKGFDYVDFGGSDKVLLTFKRKFKPEKIYKTYTFSVVRR